MENSKTHINKEMMLQEIERDFGLDVSGIVSAKIIGKIIDLINKAYAKGYAAGKSEVSSVDR